MMVLNFEVQPCIMYKNAGVAQMVEQRFCNPQAPRSIRGAGTMEKI